MLNKVAATDHLPQQVAIFFGGVDDLAGLALGPRETARDDGSISRNDVAESDLEPGDAISTDCRDGSRAMVNAQGMAFVAGGTHETPGLQYIRTCNCIASGAGLDTSVSGSWHLA